MDMMKMMARKKAMNSMMSGKPTLKIQIKEKALPLPEEEEGEGGDSKGLISMMVTPEEKKLLEKMRGKTGMEGMEEEEEFSE